MPFRLMLSSAILIYANVSFAASHQLIPLPSPEHNLGPTKNIMPNDTTAKKETNKPAPNFDDSLPITNPIPSLTSSTLSATQHMADVYRKIAERGGWPNVTSVALHDTGRKVHLLRERLAAEGDMSTSEAHASDEFNRSVVEGIKRYQERMGLNITGTLNKPTLRAMNVPASMRAHALAASAQRLSQMKLYFGERYVVVNLPSASVEAIDHGQVVRRYDAIMGDADHQSPDVVATIQSVNLNPTWTVPASIIKNELIPKMREDKTYLSKLHIRIFDAHNIEIQPDTLDWTTDKPATYILRQDSGETNSLGQIRINMPNRYAVYMHDTPAKHLFSKADHFLSHGCVRVKGVYDLAEWVLEKTPPTTSLISPASLITPSAPTTWNKQALHDKVATQEIAEIRVAKEIPVMWVYMTGWVDAEGRTHFRNDVYKRDEPPAPTSATHPDLLTASKHKNKL